MKKQHIVSLYSISEFTASGTTEAEAVAELNKQHPIDSEKEVVIGKWISHSPGSAKPHTANEVRIEKNIAERLKSAHVNLVISNSIS